MTNPVERIAEALFAYNTPDAHHFVIHDGGYAGIAETAIRALLDAGYVITTRQEQEGLIRYAADVASRMALGMPVASPPVGEGQ